VIIVTVNNNNSINNSKIKVTTGAIFLYVENILGMISGYFFWLFVARLTTPDVVGIAGSVASLSIILSTVVNLGVPVSIQKFLGRTLIKGDYTQSQQYFLCSIILLAIAEIVFVIFMLISFSSFDTLVSIDFDFLLMTATLLLVIVLSIGRLFRGIIIASINTRSLVIATAISTGMKFVIAYGLLTWGAGVLGLISAMVSFSLVETIIMALAAVRLLKMPLKVSIPFRRIGPIFSDILIGGFPYWVPTLITSVGAQLGTVLVLGWKGSSEAGYYFIAYSIYSALATVVSVIFAISFPILSAMEKGHGKLTWKTIKFSLLLSVPFTCSLMFYPAQILSIFSHQYSAGALPLVILLMSVIPVALSTGINNFYYSQGKYRKVMIIGILTSVPRTAIYFALVPLFGGLGAAVAFTLGSIMGLITSLVVVRNSDLKLSIKDISVICLVPLVIASLLTITQANYILSVIVIILLSYIIYLKLGTMTHNDVEDLTQAVPARLKRPAFKIYNLLVRNSR
jgi:O-antigen/teichoic acid export membrane protein